MNQPLVGAAKAEVEIPSPFAGVLQSVNGAEGDTLAVGKSAPRDVRRQRCYKATTDLGWIRGRRVARPESETPPTD